MLHRGFKPPWLQPSRTEAPVSHGLRGTWCTLLIRFLGCNPSREVITLGIPLMSLRGSKNFCSHSGSNVTVEAAAHTSESQRNNNIALSRLHFVWFFWHLQHQSRFDQNSFQ